jgi:hypothetical protein
MLGLEGLGQFEKEEKKINDLSELTPTSGL